jgi:hypothetical protein
VEDSSSCNELLNQCGYLWELTQNNVSKRTLERERGDGRNKSSDEDQDKWTQRFVSRGLVPMNLLPFEEAIKVGSISTLPLSQSIT